MNGTLCDWRAGFSRVEHIVAVVTTVFILLLTWYYDTTAREGVAAGWLVRKAISMLDNRRLPAEHGLRCLLLRLSAGGLHCCGICFGTFNDESDTDESGCAYCGVNARQLDGVAIRELRLLRE